MTVCQDRPQPRTPPRGVPLGRVLLVCGLAAGLWGPAGVRADTEAASRGHVLFESDFSQTEQPGITFDQEGVWSVRDGVLHAALPDEKQKRSFAYIGEESWTDYSVDLDVMGIRGVDKGIAVRMEGGKAVVVDLRSGDYGDVIVYRGFARLGHEPFPNRNGEWHHLRVEVEGGRYRVWVDGRLQVDRLERRDRRPQGRIALVAYTGGVGQCEVVYDNVVVRDLR